LSSRPGAAASLYLDFSGHYERQWGRYANVSTPAYDTDGNPGSFSAAEQAAIREIWSRVAEDYAPLNINVTTVQPPVIADRVAARIAIGGSSRDWYGASAGGVSYEGGFANSASNVGYVFAKTLGYSSRYIAEAASHEAGHLFGLEHQAAYNGSVLVDAYSSGTKALAPIMGLGYYADRSVWSRGPTPESPTRLQDDLSILASSTNGFGYAADDYGSTLTTASALPLAGTSVSLQGLIGRNDDRDIFRFATGGGPVNFSMAVAPYGANLDGVLELQNASGMTIAAANPSGTFGASLSTSLGAGTYFLVVRSSGGYGNLGRYTLTGNVAAPQSGASATPAPAADLPEGEGTQPPASQPTASSGVRIVDDGAAGYARVGAWQQVTSAGYASDTSWAAAGSGASSTFTFSGLAPGQYCLAGTWLGSRLNATDAPLTVTSGGKTLASLRINQQRASSTFTSGGAAWQNLSTFTVTGNSLAVRLGAAASGRVQADAMRLERVYSTTAGAVPRGTAEADAELLTWLAMRPTTMSPRRSMQPTLSPAAVDAVFASAIA
jgi:hypothetical protein